MDIRHCRKLLIYGGSFDPPHVAHVALPLLAMHAVGADAVAYVPAANPPHKAVNTTAAAHHRLAMLRLALQDAPHAIILTDELEREPDAPSYTVDTLEALRGRLGAGVTLRLLIGADMMRIFDQWKSPRRVVELAEPLVMVRPPDSAQSLLAALPEDAAREWRGRLLDLPLLDVSATHIRQRVAQGLPVAGWVPPLVEDYIRRHGLYRVE